MDDEHARQRCESSNQAEYGVVKPCMDSTLHLLQAGLKRTVGNFVLSDLRRFEVRGVELLAVFACAVLFAAVWRAGRES